MNYQEPVGSSASESISAPIMRETMTIVVGGKPTIVYKDDVEKSLYKFLYDHLGLPPGA